MYELRTISGLKRLAVIALIGGCSVVVASALLVRQSVGAPAFRLIVEPDDGQARIHFLQPGAGLASEEFSVDLRISARDEIDLDSPSVEVPGGQIEFADTTILPGRFKLRFGDKLFDVMQHRLEVDGRPSDWKSRERSSE